MEKEEVKTGEDLKEVTPPTETKVPEEVKKPEEPKVPEESPEVQIKARQLADLNKAIENEENRLRDIRKKQKLAKQGIEIDDEDELPKIDFEDPSAKAWDKRINDVARPAQEQLEKAKEERRLFTLRQFLSDKPSLAKNPEKIKAMMETYDRLKTSTELTSEGITMDLEKAYAAEHYDELISKGRQQRIEEAQNDALFSDVGVSRGSTTYSNNKSKDRVYTEEEKAQLTKWGMTTAEHAEMDKAMKAKVG